MSEFNRASHLRIRVRNTEAKTLLAAERGDEYHFNIYSELLERLEAKLAEELAKE